MPDAVGSRHGLHDLERNLATHRLLPRQVDYTHRAPADLALDRETGNPGNVPGFG